ncbi:prepilin-type N-terminal cleavage/methylation domain-containing protein [Thomasclavelia sp.]
MKSYKKGFTLVELVVVLMILAILLGAATFGLYSYTRYAKFKNYNEDAQTIYVAAQEALTHYKASGQLTDYAAQVKTYALKTSDAKNYNKIKPMINNEYNGRLYTIFYSPDYIKDEKGYNEQSHNLFEQLMERYLSNHNVLDGNITIEFDPSDGVVYSVSYSLQADYLYYGQDKDDDKDETVVDITNRDIKIRKQRMFGYYDVNNLTAAAPLDAEKPTITNLELVNGESLYLKWCMDDIYNEVAESFEYNIELYNGAENYTNNSQSLMKFKINSTSNLIPDKESDLPEVNCEIIKGNLTEEYKLRSYKTIENNRTYFYVVLDAIDLSSLTYQDSITGSYKTYAINNEKLAETYSFERFGLNTESIYARVRASSRSFKSSVWKQSNIEDTLFDLREKEQITQEITLTDIQTTIANISNNRHLYNIRFIEDKDISLRNLSDKYIYKQVNSINYNKAEIYKTDSISNIDGSKDRQVIKYLSKNLPSFPSLGKLNMDNQFINTSDYSVSNLKLGDDENENGVGLFKVNNGIIDGLTLKNAKVNGKEDIGAITAYNSGTIKNTVVSGEVSGIKNVGGIAGTVISSTESGTILIEDSTNNADIEGNENVGGIIGITDQAITVNKCNNTGRIIGTTNQDSSNNLGGIAGYNSLKCAISESTSSSKWKDEDALTTVSNAQYVGGIAGINNGTIKDCSTGISNQSTYVVGDKFVGGIVGAQEDQGVLTNTSIKSNKCIVVGNENVGGIIGQNTKDISNWNNEGVIICKVSNGGGIAGANTNLINNCKAFVRYNALTINYEEIKKYSTGSNIGGIAGINQGIINSDVEQENIVVSVGHNNVGGIVGNNQGTMKNQKVTGGYIFGIDNVGGSLGYNSSGDTLKDQTIKVNVNQIEGNNNVAGVIGYNQVKLDKSAELNVSFNTDSFAGYVSGKENIGGFIGLNDVYCKKLTIGNDSIYSNDMNYIKGEIYVGGVIGKDSSIDSEHGNHTMIEIKNIDNKTRIISTGYKNKYDYDLNENVNYSYTAGIIGYNSDCMTINNCSNQKQVTVNDAVQYLGGLVEINEGAVVNCTTYSLGSYTRSNVGGLVGKNAGGANMDNCSLSGIITGKDNVGGFVVDNFGTITNSYSSENAAVNASGTNVGGLVACNYNNIDETNISITVNGNGVNAGGIVGLNAGSVSNIKMTSSQNVTGNAFVGGVIGKHIGGNISGLHNINNVTAKIGLAGGVIGTVDVTDTIEVRNCINDGSVVAIMGNAGGITSEVSSSVVIKNAINNGSIKATLSHAGGIVAINNGVIESSQVNNGVEITGRGYVGGIATENHGIINECQIGSVDLSVYGAVLAGKDKNIYIGGISAINGNNGQIINTSSLESSPLTIDDSFESSYFGGVAGLNEGIITSDKNVVILANIGSSSSNFDAYFGGIAGVNNNMIKGYTFTGKITGNGGADYGYGGVAGINNNLINDCKVISTSIETKGDAANHANTGGIVGYNQDNGIIYNSTVGSNLSINAGGFGYIGGIIGLNEGQVSGVIHQDINGVQIPGKVLIETYQGSIGGIVGYNRGDGSVSDCTTSKEWQIVCTAAATDMSAGGIIGYSSSSVNSYTNLINYANVNKTVGNSLAGILGRLENSASIWTVDNCHNYGTISGTATNDGGRIGGLIGQIKYRGGNIINCSNQGDIICNSVSSISGTVGYIYALDPGEVLNINNTTNLGKISTGKINGIASGLFGQVRTNGLVNGEINIINCINAGVIEGSTEAGIVALSGNSGQFNISNCVNYDKIDEKGAGIVYVSSNKGRLKTLSNNIDSGISHYPIINENDSKLTSGNYYFINRLGSNILYGNVDVGKSKIYLANGNSVNGADINALFDGEIKDSGDEDNGKHFSVDMNSNNGMNNNNYKTPLVIDIALKDKTADLSSVNIDWYGDTSSDQRQVFYEVSLYQIGSNKPVYTSGSLIKDYGETTSEIKFDTSYTNIDYVEIKITGGVRNTNYPTGTPTASRYVAIYEIKLNGKANKETIISENPTNIVPYGTDELKVEYNGTTYVGENEAKNIKITNMPINPLVSSVPSDSGIATLARYKYENLNLAITGYTSGDDNDYSKYRPKIIKDEDIGGIYKVTWELKDSNGNDINAARYLLEVKDNKGIIVYEDTIYGSMDGYIPVNTDWGKVSVTVTALSNRANSLTSNPYNNIIMKPPLKTPNFNFVAKSNGNFDVVINNIDDYEVGDIIRIKKDSNILKTITVEIDNLNNKKSNYGEITGSNSNFVVSIQAEPGSINKNKYGKSVTFSAETRAVSVNGFNNKIIDFIGFMGASTNSLRYKINFKTGIDIQAYYRQDLLLPDTNIEGLPVAVSSSIYRVNRYATSMSTELSSIPESIANQDKVRVQSYVWSSQNDVSLYYQYIYQNISSTELKNYMGNFTSNGKLDDGYVIEKNIDGTYSVYYSESLKIGISEMKFSDDSDKKYLVKDITLPEFMTKPIIDNVTPELIDNKYTFTWKADGDSSGIDYYNITLYGVDKAGGEVELVNETVNGLSYTTDDASQWNYKQLRVVVTHLGAVDSNGMTVKLSSSSEAIYNYKLKLSQVTAPLVSIISDKHSYTYNVLFSKLIDAEEIAAVEYYEVHARTKVNGKEYEIIKNTTSDNCSMVLEFVDKDGKIIEVPEGNEIEFYVNAIAKKDNQVFTDSLTGDISSITLPHRIAKPNGENITIDKGPLSINEINTNGIIITKRSNTTIDLDANYEIKYILEGYNNQYSEPKTMDGTISNGSINLKNLISGDLSDFAGRKIKFMLRAVSSQAVSSKWSDEITLILPKGKIDFVVEDLNISENKEELTLYENNIPSSIKYELNQKSIILPVHKYSNGYDLAINYQQLNTLEDRYRFYHSLKVNNQEVKRITTDHIRVMDNGITTNPDGTINYDRFIVNYDVYDLQRDDKNNLVLDNEGNYIVNTIPTKLNEYETKVDELGNITTYIYSFDYMAKTYKGITPSGNSQSLTVIPKLYINLDPDGNVSSYQFVMLDTVGHNDTILNISSDKAITANIRFTALVNDSEHYVESQVLEYYREQFENTFIEGTRVYDPSQSIRSYLEKMLNVPK